MSTGGSVPLDQKFRRDFQRLAAVRAREALILKRSGSALGAYYLAGLAVECALKACIAKSTRRFEFPNKKRAEDAWKHDLGGLLLLAGMKDQLDAELNRDNSFAVH